VDTNLSIFGQLVNTSYLKRIDSLIKHWRIGVSNTSRELTDLNIISMYTWMIIKLGTTTTIISSQITIIVKHLVSLLNVSISSKQLDDLVATIMQGVIYDNYQHEDESGLSGMMIPNYNVALNLSNVLRYERTLSTTYIATGSTSQITIPELINATVIQIIRETQPLTTTDYGFSNLIGQISFATPLTQYEKVFIIYGIGKNVLSTSVVPIGTLENAIIYFVDTPTPSITSYNTTYPAYGQYPTTILVIVDEFDTEQISQATPKLTRISGKLDSITYDIGSNVSGYIVLKK